jgi:nanoRNase/pAp phosphatase (c-di-AMP/oligoRNAs hydrolase)
MVQGVLLDPGEKASMYSIFGGGAQGFRLGKMLQDRGAHVSFVELDPKKGAWLKEQGFECIVGDMLDIDLDSAIPHGTKAVLITAGDPAVCEAAIKRVRVFDNKVRILSISTDGNEEPLRKAGADIVLGIPEVVSSAFMKEVEDIEMHRLSQSILSAIKGSAPRGLAIFCHDNPDADTLASAWALQHVCEHHKVKAIIYYVGVMNMPQSKELVKVLGLKIKGLTTPEEVLGALGSHAKLAMVDCARPGENNSLPPTAVPNIVIDHHSTNMATKPGEAYDIRGNVGSTSSIMTSHLINLGIPMDVKLATALFYGIKTDTMDFTTNVSTLDLMSAAYLSAYVFKPLLDLFELPPMPKSTIDALGMALKDREVRRHVSIAFLGELPDRSALPMAVDMLMQQEGIQTAVALAVVGDSVQMSARNRDKKIHVGEALHLAFEGMGSAGGHATSAGGQLRIEALSSPEEKDKAAKAVQKAKTLLFDALG